MTAALHPPGHLEEIHVFQKFYLAFDEVKKKNQSKRSTKDIKGSVKKSKGNNTFRDSWNPIENKMSYGTNTIKASGLLESFQNKMSYSYLVASSFPYTVD